MGEVLQNIYERRSVRQYKDIPVAREIIETLIAAGRMAPTAINRQAWKFYIAIDKKQIKEYSRAILKESVKEMMHQGLGKLVKNALASFHFGSVIHFMREDDPVFHSAPVVIFITGQKGDEWAGLDTGLCAQNIMLAAKSMGLDTCPVGFGKYIMNTEFVKDFHLDKNEEVLLSITLGYGNETPDMHERKKDNVFYI
jgi:nitroreductase